MQCLSPTNQKKETTKTTRTTPTLSTPPDPGNAWRRGACRAARRGPGQLPALEEGLGLLRRHRTGHLAKGESGRGIWERSGQIQEGEDKERQRFLRFFGEKDKALLCSSGGGSDLVIGFLLVGHLIIRY